MGDTVSFGPEGAGKFSIDGFLRRDTQKSIDRAGYIMRNSGLTACSECVKFVPYVIVEDDAILNTIEGKREDVAKILVGLCTIGSKARNVVVCLNKESFDCISDKGDAIVGVDMYNGVNSSCPDMSRLQDAVLTETGRTAEQFKRAASKRREILNTSFHVPSIVTGLYKR